MPSVESFNRIPKTTVDIREVEIVIGDGVKTSGSVNIPAGSNGQLVAFEIIAPNLDTDTTFDLDLLTANGSDLLGAIGDAIADNITTIKQIIDTIRRFLTGQEKVVLTCATDQTGDKTFTLIFYILSVGA